MSRRSYGTGQLIQKGGNWHGRWSVPGGRRQRKIGPVRSSGSRDGLSQKQAEARLREMMSEDRRRTPQPKGSTLSVADMGARLKTELERQGRKRSHIESVRYHLSKHIDPTLGTLPVAQVIDDDVRRLVDRMIAAGRAPKTIRNVVGTLHSVLEMAVELHILDRNPARMAKLPTPQRSTDIHFLTQAEIERVLKAAPGPEVSNSERDWWPSVRLLTLAATLTGMRLGELRALRWQDIDYGAMKVRVRYSFVRGEMGAPKSRRSSRAIPVASRLVDELENHHRTTVWNQEADLVFAHPHTGRPLDRVRLLQHFKAALIRANVRPVRIHDLRHTFATTVAASGKVSLRTLQEWMGHEDIRTTQIYADYMPGEREQQLLDAAFSVASLSPDWAHEGAQNATSTPANNA